MEEIKVQETLQAIRKRLRLAMNGVIASSMREKGMQYKLIFGVPFPEIRQIAKKLPNPVLNRMLTWRRLCGKRMYAS